MNCGGGEGSLTSQIASVSTNSPSSEPLQELSIAAPPTLGDEQKDEPDEERRFTRSMMKQGVHATAAVGAVPRCRASLWYGETSMERQYEAIRSLSY
jgi:hypothetical protein